MFFSNARDQLIKSSGTKKADKHQTKQHMFNNYPRTPKSNKTQAHKRSKSFKEKNNTLIATHGNENGELNSSSKSNYSIQTS